MRPDLLENRLLVIVDYNLARVDDVPLIAAYARERHGLRTVLVRPNLAPHDRHLADYLIDLHPLAPGFVEQAAAEIFDLGVPLGVLPFSDNAVQAGAALAARLGARGDSPELADAAFSKEIYRAREHRHLELFEAAGAHVPAFAVVRSLPALARFAARCRGGFVLKPTCEGNNRGVLRLAPGDSLEAALREAAPYRDQGLIAEELVDFPEEYSFDGVGHLSFVTEKLSAGGRYPVERGHTVNAPIPAATVAAVERAGTLANLMCGQRLGPFHNEVKVDPDEGRAAVMEPNRRPAGMFIWHLAGRVFGVNFFHLWVDQMVTGRLPRALPAPRGTAAIRMLPAPSDGTFVEPGGERAALERELFREIQGRMGPGDDRGATELFDFTLTARGGARVFAVPRDNSHFVARVCAFGAAPGDAVERALDRFEATWLSAARGLVQAPRSERAALRLVGS